MRLYHTGVDEIRKPDIRRGRKNADFGQGFYLTPDRPFSERWAKERRDSSTVINTYELQTEGLRMKRFSRDEEWFDYICGNRNGKADGLADVDVIVGPIANDTIYDVLGITTSGFLNREQSLKLLLIGPEYSQVVIKTEKAASQLQWISSEELGRGTIAGWRETVLKEQEDYQALFAEKMQEVLEQR